MNLKILVDMFLFFNVIQSKLMDTSQYLVSRQKRALIWNDKGTNLFQFIFGLGLPIDVERHAITMGIVFKAFYTLPTNASAYLAPNIDYTRRKRSTSRWFLYESLESLMARYNNGDGKSCILRTICEVAHSPIEQKAGLLSEIVAAILKPSTTNEEFYHPTNMDYHSAEKLGKTEGNCHYFYPGCKLNILEQYSRFLT